MPNPWESPMAMLNTTCPGSTRKRRALAAAAFDERMVEEEARKAGVKLWTRN